MNKYDRMSKDHLIQQIRALEHQLLLLQRETCIYWNLNREEFNYLTEDHREVICRLAPDGTILFINPAGCRFFRQSWPDLIGNNLGNISEPDFNRKLQSLFNMLSPTQPVMDWEYGPTFLNHTFLNWNWRIRGLFSADQTLREIQLVGTDLTEQKFFKQVLDKTKQTLHKEILHYEQAQQDFYELFDLASEIIYTHDFEGRLLYINKNGESILGFETGTLKGRSIFELVVPDKHNLLEERISSRFNNQQKINYELPVVKADGETAILELTSRIIFREDQPHAIMGIGRDITQRKQIESALREGEAKFRKLAETSPSFIVVVQGQHYKYVNPTFERLTGYSQEELLAIHFWDIIHPDYRDLVKGRGLARQQGAELISRYEFKINGKNGQELWIDLSADCIEFEGRPAIIATGIEISSRKELEHALINSEENFRKLANTAPALIFVVQNYRFQYVNAFFTNVTGYNAYDILELNAMDILHWDYHELLDNELTQLLLGKIPSFRHDIIIFSKTGREYWMDLSANRIEYGGKPAVIATAYDITARKELESALTNSEENFRRLAETAPALIYVVQNRELVFFNLETLRVTGYSRDELINMKNWEFIHPDHRDWIDSITTARHRGEDAPRRYETVILNKEGQSLWIEVAVSIIQFNNQPASLGVGIDITERKRALEQITYLSYHDRLTGLYNRAFLEEKLRELDEKISYLKP
jgi:PAS domain S-box-containing protein